MRKEGDSNPRTALGGYTLSRRASSATRAPFLIWWCKSKTFILNSDGNGRKNHFFPAASSFIRWFVAKNNHVDLFQRRMERMWQIPPLKPMSADAHPMKAYLAKTTTRHDNEWNETNS